MEFMELVLVVAITMLSFFVAAPCVLSTVSLFGVQKRFAQAMIEEGVIDAAEVQRIQPKKQLAGVVITLIFIAALAAMSWKTPPFGFICFGGGFALGVLKYRKVTQFNSLTVKRFQKTYPDSFDAKKLNKYIERTF